jgi:hypothetical protein
MPIQQAVVLDFDRGTATTVVPRNAENERTLAEALKIQGRGKMSVTGVAPPPPSVGK